MTGQGPHIFRATAALGIVQILAWGSTYYLLTILAEPIMADTGWSRPLVTGGVSVGLLATGVAAAVTGRLIQRWGGRVVLASGMALISTGLILMALAGTPAAYLAAWVVMGIGMGAGLYDAVFSTLGQVFGADGRRAITQLTLWGGFASTICWPLTQMLVEGLGWRGTCLVYAGVHLAVSLPLCLMALPRGLGAGRVAQPSGAATAGGPAFWLLAVAGTALNLINSIVSVHLIVLLQAQGVPLAAAVALGTLIGPAQVGARVVEMALGGRRPAVWTMVVATVLVAAGMAGMRAGVPMAAALIVYGAGNGLWSIARGAVPLAVFGAQGYPVLMGRLARPAQLAAGVAPALGAVMIDRLGVDPTLAVLAALACVPPLCAVLLVFQVRRMG